MYLSALLAPSVSSLITSFACKQFEKLDKASFFTTQLCANYAHKTYDAKLTPEEAFNWVISSDLFPLKKWHTHPSPSLFWQSLLSWHLLCSLFSCSFLLLEGSTGPGSWPILLSVPLSPAFRSNERPPSFNFQKARWDGFASYFDSHCPSSEEYSSLSLSSAAALFTSLALNAAKSSIPFGRIKRPSKAWWSAEVEEAVSERRKAFAAAHRSDEDRQAYISASRCASSVIAKAKGEAWQTTWSSLSPKSHPKSVHSLLRYIAGSPSSSSFSPNFPNCSSPRESASVYAAYLRSHFSVLSQRPFVAEPEATSLSSAEPRALRSLTRPFALLSLALNFMRLPPTSPRTLPLAQTKVHQIGTPPPSGQSRHHRLPLTSPIPLLSPRLLYLPYESLWLISLFYLMKGFLSPNLLSNFRFGQTWSETKTLQIVLESFCIHSPADASFYLF